MRIVFMGTPDIAATVLKRIADVHEVVGAYTRPDAVRGRGKQPVASPVKALAETLGIAVYGTNSFGEDEIRTLKSLNPDAICVSAYGVVLPQEVLDIPRFGCLNVHTSLLPRWRGAAPIEHAILAGDEKTGVCIMLMEAGLDTGAFCSCRETPVDGRYAAELADLLAEEGSIALLEALDALEHGKANWTVQPEQGVTYATKIEKRELNPQKGDDATRFVAKVRASTDAHPARLSIAGKTLAIQRASVVADHEMLALCEDMQPGQARFVRKKLVLKTLSGLVLVEQVKPDGKKSMDASSFAGGIQGIKGKTLNWESC